MAIFDKKDSFVKQIAIYMGKNESQKAFDLAKEFAGLFPKEMVAHYLLAKSALALGRLEDAAAGARKAFNLAASQDDMVACAVLAGTAYYELKEYQKGFDMLKAMEEIKHTEELERLLFIFSLALNNQKEAMKHIDYLYLLNKKTAEELMLRFIG